MSHVGSEAYQYGAFTSYRNNVWNDYFDQCYHLEVFACLNLSERQNGDFPQTLIYAADIDNDYFLSGFSQHFISLLVLQLKLQCQPLAKKNPASLILRCNDIPNV